MMSNIVWSLTWRLLLVLGYPLGFALRSAQAIDNSVLEVEPVITIDAFDKLAQSYPTSLIISACIVCWFMCSVLGALYPTPDDLQATEIRPWLRFMICLTGGFVAFLWVLHDAGSLNLLTPLWVGGVAFVAPHLIQIVPTLVKARLGLGGDK